MAGKKIRELEERNKKIIKRFEELNRVPGRTIAWIIKQISKEPDIGISERQIKRILGYK